MNIVATMIQKKIGSQYYLSQLRYKTIAIIADLKPLDISELYHSDFRHCSQKR